MILSTFDAFVTYFSEVFVSDAYPYPENDSSWLVDDGFTSLFDEVSFQQDLIIKDTPQKLLKERQPYPERTTATNDGRFDLKRCPTICLGPDPEIDQGCPRVESRCPVDEIPGKKVEGKFVIFQVETSAQFSFNIDEVVIYGSK